MDAHVTNVLRVRFLFSRLGHLDYTIGWPSGSIVPSRFRFERYLTAGPFDLDAELKLWISGSETPIIKQFNRSLDIYERQRVLAACVLR
jgi:hypothetical protein